MLFNAQSSILHSLDYSLVGCDHLALRSVFHGLLEDVVCVDMVAYHDISVAFTGKVWKLACLVGVHHFFQVQNFDEHVMLLFQRLWLYVLFLFQFLCRSYPLSLTLHVPFLGLIGLWKVF